MNIRKAISCAVLVLSLCCVEARGQEQNPSRPFEEPVPGEGESLDGIRRQMDLIRAGIYSRQGLHEKSLKLYRELLARYPEDEEIRADYIETLVDTRNYDGALHEIKRLLEKKPSSLRGQRILARIYGELGRTTRAFPVYEEILRLHRRDAGIWSDYAYARLQAGDWSDALSNFCRVLEIDPENRDALVNVHEILREHRPRLETGYRDYVLDGEDATVETYSLRYGRQLTGDTALDVNYDRVRIDRAEQPGVASINERVSDLTAVLSRRLNRQWSGRLGIGGYDGLGGGTSLLFGLDLKIGDRVVFRGNYATKRPWYDPIDAVAWDGNSDQFSFGFDWAIDPAWNLFAGANQMDYSVTGSRDYGTKRDAVVILSRRFFERPDFTVSYSYYRSHFSYESDTFRPVVMIGDEGVHGLSGRFEHRPCRYWSYSVSGGFRRDHRRKVDSWDILPEIRVRLGNRTELTLNYEYSSEAATAAGGVTKTFNILLKIIL